VYQTKLTDFERDEPALDGGANDGAADGDSGAAGRLALSYDGHEDVEWGGDRREGAAAVSRTRGASVENAVARLRRLLGADRTPSEPGSPSD
jgi:hypothetical protein